MTCTALTWFSLPALANPEDGVVVGGAAEISSMGKALSVIQKTDRAAINWRSFNIAADETVRFIQPGNTSILLNRVTGSDPSRIFGSIEANGKVFLINQNGILFGAGAKIDVGSLIATSADIDTADFMQSSNSFNFSKAGRDDARIVNQGSITAKDAGLVGLVAPQVENSGIIKAYLGRIQLGASDTATLDLYGDGLMNLEVTESALRKEINQTGLISAEGGLIQLSAADGRDIVNSLIGVSGIVDARAVGSRQGRIIIYAPGTNAVENNLAANKDLKAGGSTVIVDGQLNASGYSAGGEGGKIELLGDRVMLAGGAVLDASGDTGGGDIRIGGDYLGTGITPAAHSAYVDKDSLILNDAISMGNGGRTIIWSDGDASFYGNIFSRGGAYGGNGGFVETSGHETLEAEGFVDLTAPAGEKGTYLLDPANIAVYGNVTPRFQATDSAVNLLGSLRFWVDGSDSSTITLTYSNDALSAALVNGTAGANTISTTTNLNLTAALAAGAKIRLGNVNGQTALASDASNSNTYTIQSVSYTAGVGTTITLTSNLTTSYNGGAGNNNLYRGLVSQWNDKSNNSYHMTSSTTTRMPLWISTAQNNRGGVRFDGADNMISATGAYPINADYTVGAQVNQTAANTGNVLSGIGSGHAFYFNNSLRICMFSGGCFATSNTNLPYGTPGLIEGTFVNSTRVGNVYQNSVNVGNGTAAASNTQNTFNLGSYGNANYFTGFINDAYIYNSVLSTSARNLVEQYESALRNLALDPHGPTAFAEATEAMDATNGFSVFSTRYLERLSQTANISLQASNNITLDLQSDTLNLTTAGRSLTLTAGNQINTLSAGNITTNGGNITFNAAGGISFAHALGLTSNGGNITLSNNLGIGAAQTINAGTGNVTFTGTVNGTGSVTASGNGATLSNTWGGGAPLTSISLDFASGYTLPSISATSISARATGGSSDLIIGAGSVLNATGAGNSLVLSAGRNFINNSGSGALLSPAGRWLVYSTRAADNQRNGLMPDAEAIYNATYLTTPPAGIPIGNRLLFSDLASAAPVLTFSADDQTKQYGSANPALTFVRSGSFVDADTAIDAFTGAPALTTTVGVATGAGSYANSLTASVGTLSSFLGYVFSFVDGDFTVTPAPLTITADDKSKLYGQPNPAFTASFIGLVAGDVEADIPSLSLTTAATQFTAPGAYTINATGAISPDYTITLVNGLLTIGGSIPSPAFPGSVSGGYPEIIYYLMKSINTPVKDASEMKIFQADLKFDVQLDNFLSCSERKRLEDFGNDCW